MKETVSSASVKEFVITLNRKAFHDYEIISRLEAGISLKGTEVKSLRTHKANIGDAYARIKKSEAWLLNANIPEYKFGNLANHEPTRERKLLLHSNEIKRLTAKLQDKGLTLIPLKLYFLGAKVKVEIGLARGKRKYDKRQTIMKEESKRRLKKIQSHRI